MHVEKHHWWFKSSNDFEHSGPSECPEFEASKIGTTRVLPTPWMRFPNSTNAETALSEYPCRESFFGGGANFRHRFQDMELWLRLFHRNSSLRLRLAMTVKFGMFASESDPLFHGSICRAGHLPDRRKQNSCGRIGLCSIFLWAEKSATNTFLFLSPMELSIAQEPLLNNRRFF